MDPIRARQVLGVGADADHEAIRAAYRRLLRTRHPDVAGDGRRATRATAELNVAYAVVMDELRSGRLRAAATPTPPPAAPADGEAPVAETATRGPGPVVDDVGRDVRLPAATLEVLDQLCEAADRLGDLSYVDRSAGILETILSPPGGPPCSLLVQLRQRGDETLANCTLESLDRRPGPPIEEVVARLRAELAVVEAERRRAP